MAEGERQDVQVVVERLAFTQLLPSQRIKYVYNCRGGREEEEGRGSGGKEGMYILGNYSALFCVVCVYLSAVLGLMQRVIHNNRLAIYHTK